MGLYSRLLPLLLLILLLAEGCVGYIRVCYYTNWSQFRSSPTPFTPEDIDPNLCSHIIFAFGDLQGTRIETTEFNDEELYKRLVELKKSNPKLRVMLSVGGWLAGGRQFSSLVASEDSMLEFVNNAIAYLRRFNLDGLDVDWEYPGDTQRDSEAPDRIRFTRLLQLLRSGFEEEAEQTGNDRLVLSAAVIAEIDLSRQYYQIPQISRSVDFINLMAYDFHGQWDLGNGARHHSALYPEAHAAVQGWLQDGFPAEKLVLGTAAFARTFTLAAEPRGTGVGQRAVNVGVPGNFTDTEGLLSYREVCDFLDNGGWQRVWLADQQVPVAYGNMSDGRWGWAGYDDKESITAKANYVKENGLAGAMVWAISNDDFNNRCGEGQWPILSTLNEQLPDEKSEPPESPPTLATPAPTTTSTTTKTPMTPVTIPYNTTRWLASPKTTVKAAGRDGEGEGERRGEGRGGKASVAPVPRTTLPPVVPTRAVPDIGPGYRQCSISDTFGPSLQCTSHHGKTGSRTKFYLYCFNGFFAIECSCLPGFFYNRCIQACDSDSNFLACPFRY